MISDDVVLRGEWLPNGDGWEIAAILDFWISPKLKESAKIERKVIKNTKNIKSYC